MMKLVYLVVIMNLWRSCLRSVDCWRSVIPKIIQNIMDNGDGPIIYDDTYVKVLDMNKLWWHYEPSNELSAKNAGFSQTVPSNEQEVLAHMFQTFGNLPFLRLHTHEFGQAPIANSYMNEERKFLENLQVLSRSSVPKSAIVIGRHTNYNPKVLDDQPRKLKARIAPHGNEDYDSENIRTECCMCSPIGIKFYLLVKLFVIGVLVDVMLNLHFFKLAH